jgi:hypothetical protein
MVVAVTAVASEQQSRRWVVTATAALLTAWLLAPAAVPIYDGIGNPDEPYRWVKPPANAKTTKAPTGAHKVLEVSGGVSRAGFANTGESGPQLSLYLPQTSLKAPAGASTIDVTVEPLAPSPPLPTDGTIVTNVYHLTATAEGQPVQVVGTGRSEPSLQMRAPDARQPGPVFEHRTATGWQRMKTIKVGTDIYQSAAPELGDWALVQLTNPTSANGSGGGIKWELLVPGIGLLVAAIVVLMVRLRRTGAVPS